MKSILVAVDHTESSLAAQALAIELAGRHNAHLTGLGILDVAAIARPEPVPIGGMSIKVQRDRELIRRERRQLEQSLEMFSQQCQAQGIKPQLLSREGGQFRELEREAARHDLIVKAQVGELAAAAVEVDPRHVQFVGRILQQLVAAQRQVHPAVVVHVAPARRAVVETGQVHAGVAEGEAAVVMIHP